MQSRTKSAVVSIQYRSINESTDNTDILRTTPDTPTISINGIEVTPIERLDSPDAKQFALGREEKEVIPGTKATICVEHKALPDLPDSWWTRIPLRYRILVIACIQLSLAVIAGLSLGIVKTRHSHR